MADAVVTCDVCEDKVLSGVDGRFSLPRPGFTRELTLTARKARRTASRTVVVEAGREVELVLKAGVTLTGTAWLEGGQPAAGVEVSGLHVDNSEAVTAVTDERGRFSLEVPGGIYRFAQLVAGYRSSVDPPALIFEVTESQRELTLGPGPGTGAVAVRLVPAQGYALWAVPGVVTRVGNPPLELLRRSGVHIVYQPRTDRLTLGGLAPGPWTLVWGSFNGPTPGGPLLVPVNVPTAGEVALVR